MRSLTRSLLVSVAATAALAPVQAARAEPTPNGYPRTFAITGTGEGLRLSRLEVRTRASGMAANVTVRVAGVSVAGTRRMEITIAPCIGSASSPTCKPAARHVIAVGTTAFGLTKTFTVPRPAARPGALRVQVHATGSMPAPPCTATRALDSICKDPRFKLSGDLLLNGGAWAVRQGTWWGITSTSPAGVTFDRIVYNSRIYGWAATSASAARVGTTIGSLGAAPARTYTTDLVAGVPKALDRTPRFGTGFESRAHTTVLDYAAAINAGRLFTVKVPLPRWTFPTT